MPGELYLPCRREFGNRVGPPNVRFRRWGQWHNRRHYISYRLRLLVKPKLIIVLLAICRIRYVKVSYISLPRTEPFTIGGSTLIRQREHSLQGGSENQDVAR